MDICIHLKVLFGDSTLCLQLHILMSACNVNNIVIAGILFPLGDACFGRHFWFTNLARPAGNHCWTSVSLLDCVASIGRWKEHIKDSKMGVSLLFLFSKVILYHLLELTFSPCLSVAFNLVLF